MDVNINLRPAPTAGSVKASIPVKAYEQLCRERALTGWSISKMIARLADDVEQGILARLTADEKRRYFAQELSPADYEAVLARRKTTSPSAPGNCDSQA
jgi:hypothetical protein